MPEERSVPEILEKAEEESDDDGENGAPLEHEGDEENHHEIGSAPRHADAGGSRSPG